MPPRSDPSRDTRNEVPATPIPAASSQRSDLIDGTPTPRPNAGAPQVSKGKLSYGGDPQSPTPNKGNNKSHPVKVSSSKRTGSIIGADLPDSRKGWVSPLPTDSFDSNTIRTLHDVLRVTPPVSPDPYTEKALNSMKKLTEAEVSLAGVSALKKVVYLPNLVTQVQHQAEQQLRSVPIDLGVTEHIRAVSSMHPHDTTRFLTPEMNSEKDVEMWTYATLWRPAVGANRAVDVGDIEYNIHTHLPFVSSAPYGGIIPDGQLVGMDTFVQQLLSGGVHPKVVLTMEIKCQPAFEKCHLGPLQHLPEGVEPGTAMRFVWPDKLTVATDSQTRLLVQVWSQLHENDCDLGIISTSHWTTFVARGRDKGNRDTLYISPSYGREACPAYAVYCWFAIALGKISFKDLNLPMPNSSWWPAPEGRYGICRETLYEKYRVRENNNRRTGRTRVTRGPKTYGK